MRVRSLKKIQAVKPKVPVCAKLADGTIRPLTGNFDLIGEFIIHTGKWRDEDEMLGHVKS